MQIPTRPQKSKTFIPNIRKPAIMRRGMTPPVLSSDLKARMTAAQSLQTRLDKPISQEERELISQLVKSPEPLRMSSANPLVQRLIAEGGGILDTSRHRLLYPEEEQRAFQRARIPSHSDRTAASVSRKLDDWQNARPTRELMEMDGSQLRGPSPTKPSLGPSLKLRPRIPVRGEQDARSRLARSVQSLCSTLYGENRKQTDAFIDKLANSLGRLYDDNNCAPSDVPVIPFLLNICQRMFGQAFPSFSRLGNDMLYLLADVYRNTLLEPIGQNEAIVGLHKLTKGTITPQDCAMWLCFINFGFAFFEFCRLAGTEKPLASPYNGKQPKKLSHPVPF